MGIQRYFSKNDFPSLFFGGFAKIAYFCALEKPIIGDQISQEMYFSMSTFIICEKTGIRNMLNMK